MTKLIVVVFAILCIIGPARGSQIVTLQTSSGKNLPIFLDGAAADRAATLGDALPNNPQLAMTVVRCVVKSGTRALIEGGSVKATVWAYPVTIIDGDLAGCRGVVPGDWIKSPDGKLPY